MRELDRLPYIVSQVILNDRMMLQLVLSSTSIWNFWLLLQLEEFTPF